MFVLFLLVADSGVPARYSPVDRLGQYYGQYDVNINLIM